MILTRLQIAFYNTLSCSFQLETHMQSVGSAPLDCYFTQPETLF